jgi:hypothetical protein
MFWSQNKAMRIGDPLAHLDFEDQTPHVALVLYAQIEGGILVSPRRAVGTKYNCETWPSCPILEHEV